LDSFAVVPRGTHLAIVYLRKPKNRNATILQCVVIKFRTHVNDVSDTRSNDLIHVSFGRNTSANGNAFGYEIERYGHGRMLRRRPLPVDLLEVLIAYYFMWHTCRPAPEQCEGCTWVTSQARELSYIHSRDVTFAVFCQGPYEESARYRDFMGWEMPWYAAPQDSLNTLMVGRRVGMMHIACYLQQPSKAFETYWTTVRGVEGMDNNYRLLDLTVYGRQEPWEDSPPGWPQQCTYTD